MTPEERKFSQHIASQHRRMWNAIAVEAPIERPKITARIRPAKPAYRDFRRDYRRLTIEARKAA